MGSYGKYDGPIKIADGIYWVGFRGEHTNLLCNPYLIVENDQAVLIDAGSRTDFAVVMMKILQAGVDPGQIVALIYQHYDPDLCGSMPNFIDMCDNPTLEVLSEKGNIYFLSYYIHRSKVPLLSSINEHNFQFTFGGRRLRFLSTPYAHSQGSFVTYDEKTRTLFTSDLFGSFSTQWDLFLELETSCYHCTDHGNCPIGKTYCPLPDLVYFHQKILTCEKALWHAIRKIEDLDVDRIAPQHGSVINQLRDIRFIVDKLQSLKGVGIDALSQD